MISRFFFLIIGDEENDNEENKIEEEKEDTIKIENSLKVWSFQAINV